MIYGVAGDLTSRMFSFLVRAVDEANGTQANDDSATFSLFDLQISIDFFPSNFNYLNELSTR
jgi:hypothetical protein